MRRQLKCYQADTSLSKDVLRQERRKLIAELLLLTFSSMNDHV
jgi:hypothetical protein